MTKNWNLTRNFCSTFRKDQRGNFVMTAAVAFLPLLTIAGMSIDLRRQISADAHIQFALDAAALYTVKYTANLTPQELEAKAESLFLANLVNNVAFEINGFSATISENGNLELEAVGYVDPIFMQIAGFPNLGIRANSETIAKSSSGIELVIAFDTTASMGFGNTWEAAVGTLENILEDLKVYSGNNEFYVSLLPFSDRVNVGSHRTAWLDGAVPGGAPNWWNIADHWNGCVEPREENIGSFPWALDDDTAFSEPFSVSIPNITGGLGDAHWNWAPACPSVALTGPTTDVSLVINAAESLTRAGTGRFDVAMAWSWRLLSPQWVGQWNVANYPALNQGSPLGEIDRRKIVVYVTDGRTEGYTWELDKTRSWGWNEGSRTGFEHMVNVCNQMKGDDIEIYMIRVNGNGHAEPYMQDCATSPNHYKTVSNNTELALAFSEIGIGIKTELRIVR
ncbi:MAG: VWA domain-containing protein [Robiginitomaculum sp.]|nr:VWA domain-containing protein [Robiginitomaculum sp.]